MAESIKKQVKIPVIGVGVIRTPSVAEEILEKKRSISWPSEGRFWRIPTGLKRPEREGIRTSTGVFAAILDVSEGEYLGICIFGAR